MGWNFLKMVDNLRLLLDDDVSLLHSITGWIPVEDAVAERKALLALGRMSRRVSSYRVSIWVETDRPSLLGLRNGLITIFENERLAVKSLTTKLLDFIIQRFLHCLPVLQNVASFIARYDSEASLPSSLQTMLDREGIRSRIKEVLGLHLLDVIFSDGITYILKMLRFIMSRLENGGNFDELCVTVPAYGQASDDEDSESYYSEFLILMETDLHVMLEVRLLDDSSGHSLPAAEYKSYMRLSTNLGVRLGAFWDEEDVKSEAEKLLREYGA